MMNVKARIALVLLLASSGPIVGMYRFREEVRRDGIGCRSKKVIAACLIALAWQVGGMSSDEPPSWETISFEELNYVRESQCGIHPEYHTSIECRQGWLMNAEGVTLARVCNVEGLKIETEDQTFFDPAHGICGAGRIPDEHDIKAAECYYEALQHHEEYTYMSGFTEQLKGALAYVTKIQFLPTGALIYPLKEKR